MSLAGFAFLVALVGAAIILVIVIGLAIYAMRRVKWNSSAGEVYAALDTIKPTRRFKVLKPVARIATGLFWGGLIVGIIAAIVGA